MAFYCFGFCGFFIHFWDTFGARTYMGESYGFCQHAMANSCNKVGDHDLITESLGEI